MQDSAADVSVTLDADDPLLLRLWPFIVADMDMDTTDPGIFGSEARRTYLENLPHLAVFMKKGTKASKSRWFSWNQAFRDEDQYHHSKLLVLLFYCVKKHFIKNFDEVFHSGGTVPEIDEDGKPKKAKFANTLHKVTVDMADWDVVSMNRMVSFTFAAETVAHGLCAQGLKSPASTLAHYINWSQWSWLQPINATVKALGDLRALRKIGFVVNYNRPLFQTMKADAPFVGCEDGLAQNLLSLIASYMRHRCSSMSYHTSAMPGALAPLLSDDVAVVNECLQLLRLHTEVAGTCCLL